MIKFYTVSTLSLSIAYFFNHHLRDKKMVRLSNYPYQDDPKDSISTKGIDKSGDASASEIHSPFGDADDADSQLLHGTMSTDYVEHPKVSLPHVSCLAD